MFFIHFQESPATADTPGASSTVSTATISKIEELQQHALSSNTLSNTRSQSPLVNVENSEDFVMAHNNSQLQQNSETPTSESGAAHQSMCPPMNQQSAEPEVKRFRSSLPGDQNHQIHLLNHSHAKMLHDSHQSMLQRRPRQRKPQTIKQNGKITDSQLLQPSLSQQQAAAGLLSLFNNASLLNAMQQPQQQQQQQTQLQQQLQTSQPIMPSILTGGTGALDLSVRNIDPSLQAPGGDTTRVRSLILGYRESATFLLKAADELETFVTQLQSINSVAAATAFGTSLTNGNGDTSPLNISQQSQAQQNGVQQTPQEICP